MDDPLVYLTGVLALGLLAQWFAWRFHLPAILLLLLFGFAAGQFADPEAIAGRELLFAVVSLSVSIILFEGGLTLRFSELREVGRAVFRLVTVGILVTWILTAAAARLFLDLDMASASLLGAILVVTGPTVIMPLLRQIRPSRRVGSVVKWEGIVNDPIGAVLAVLVYEAVRIGGFREAFANSVGGLAATVLIGVTISAASAALLVQLLKRFRIPAFLRNIAFLVVVVVTFTASNLLQPESGLVTVTLFGIILANQRAVTIQHVVKFKENLRVLLISCLFIVLAARVRLDDLTALGVPGLFFVAALLLVVRPAAVFLSTIRTELPLRERVFLAWLAPRGIVAAAVSSVFALELAYDGHPGAQQIMPATFLVIVVTVTVYGLTAAPLARWLGIAESDPQGLLIAGAHPFVKSIAGALQAEGYQVLLVDTNQQNIAAARMAGIPTCWASVLSEYVQEEIDLSGIGRFLAMTPNDHLNALAAQAFLDVLDSAEVYQLPTPAADMQRHEKVSSGRMARRLFGPEATFTRLAARFRAGAVIKSTPLTEEFDYQTFRKHYGESALVLFTIRPSGRLVVATVDSPPSPQPGETIISLVYPTDV